MTDRATILARIRKCLALSKSANEHEAEVARLKGQRDAAAEALEPFASFAQTFVDDEGWAHPPMRERIVDWFGPSDFRQAAATLAQIKRAHSMTDNKPSDDARLTSTEAAADPDYYLARGPMAPIEARRALRHIPSPAGFTDVHDYFRAVCGSLAWFIPEDFPGRDKRTSLELAGEAYNRSGPAAP